MKEARAALLRGDVGALRTILRESPDLGRKPQMVMDACKVAQRAVGGAHRLPRVAAREWRRSRAGGRVASGARAPDRGAFLLSYREPAGGGALFNLSDALVATFCP